LVSLEHNRVLKITKKESKKVVEGISKSIIGWTKIPGLAEVNEKKENKIYFKRHGYEEIINGESWAASSDLVQVGDADSD
jgi:hypothetical protein